MWGFEPQSSRVRAERNKPLYDTRIWCPRRDLNPHDSRQWILSPPRFPVTTQGHWSPGWDLNPHSPTLKGWYLVIRLTGEMNAPFGKEDLGFGFGTSQGITPTTSRTPLPKAYWPCVVETEISHYHHHIVEEWTQCDSFPYRQRFIVMLRTRTWYYCSLAFTVA